MWDIDRRLPQPEYLVRVVRAQDGREQRDQGNNRSESRQAKFGMLAEHLLYALTTSAHLNRSSCLTSVGDIDITLDTIAGVPAPLRLLRA